MTRLVIDIGELPDTLAKLREAAEAAARDGRDAAAARVFILADAIEAVADKQYVVLDPKEVVGSFGTLPGQSYAQTIARCLRDLAQRDQLGSTVPAAMARNLADRFASPLPEEPGVVGTVVNDRYKEAWVRVSDRGTPWHNGSLRKSWEDLLENLGPVEVVES